MRSSMLRRLFSAPLRFPPPFNPRLFSSSSSSSSGRDGIWGDGSHDRTPPLSLFDDPADDRPPLSLPQEHHHQGPNNVNANLSDPADLDRREQHLRDTLAGPNRAFGDLIAASGVTQPMLDSLILLRDVTHVPGLSPLEQIQDRALAKLNATSSRTDLERRKQEELAKARVKQVDEQGRAYGTGKRKCSVARVWIQPGSGKILVNDKEFDLYFPILDHRADLLQPFTVTHTLGRWDVNCTVKGGGVSGQVGAIRLGISRALEKFEPAYRPYLKAVGYLTRDSRVVERKKPGKAKARKSFQWVKR